MSFDITTTRFLTKEQVQRLNNEAEKTQSPTFQPEGIVDGLDEGRYIVQEARVNTETNQVRARILINIGMIPSLWVEMSLEDWRLLPTAEIPGEDKQWNDLPLAIQDRTGEEEDEE